eukprot:463918-Pleurochrysis_carterae.AAC.3
MGICASAGRQPARGLTCCDSKSRPTCGGRQPRNAAQQEKARPALAWSKYSRVRVMVAASSVSKSKVSAKALEQSCRPLAGSHTRMQGGRNARDLDREQGWPGEPGGFRTEAWLQEAF